MNTILKLEHIQKYYGNEGNITKAIKDISFSVEAGEFLGIMGASGSGKTTLLRCLNFLERPNGGTITVNGETLFDASTAGMEKDADLRRKRLHFGMVFQSFNLFPQYTALQNVTLAEQLLAQERPDFKQNKKKILEEIDAHGRQLLERMGLSERMDHYPHQLSGGQQQRVLLARALVNEPKVLLLDEPLGALDLKLRKQMQVELKRLQKKLGITFVYVTHDQEEALTMSDRIAVMHQGHFEQIGTAKEIYENPQTKFVASFIGESNIFEANVDTIEGTDLGLTMENGKVRAKGEGFVKEEIVYISVRPENTHLSDKPVDGFTLKGIVKDQIYVGSVRKTIVELPNGKEVKVNNHPDATVYPDGTAVSVYWEPDKAVVIHTKEDKMYDAIEDAVLK